MLLKPISSLKSCYDKHSYLITFDRSYKGKNAFGSEMNY